MDKETGEIKMFKDGVVPEGFEQIDINELTQLQKATMQVSPYDNKSVAGKLYTGCRADRRRALREQRKLDK